MFPCLFIAGDRWTDEQMNGRLDERMDIKSCIQVGAPLGSIKKKRNCKLQTGLNC